MRGVWKNAWIVAATVVVAVLLSFVRSTLQAQVWASTATVRVLNASSSALLPDQSKVDPAREVEIQRLAASSPSLQTTVYTRLGKDAGRIQSVAITGDATADAVQFEVDSGSKAVAQRAAQTYADTFVETRRAELADLTKAQTDKLSQDATDLQNQINAADQRLAQIAPQVIVDSRGVPLLAPESEESKSVRSNREALATRLADTQKQAQQLAVDSSVRQGAIAVVAPAPKPTDPVQPMPFRDAIIAAALGLFLGVALALARAQFDDRIREVRDVDPVIPPGVATVGIPYNANHAKAGQEVILAPEERRSQEREAYRALRTTLLFGRPADQLVRRVLVTSPNQGDGKTTTAANLALSLATSGRRVVLVDCDLRCPRMHAVFGLGNDIGLASVIRGTAPLQDALQTVELPDSQQLHMLTSGPLSENPAELLMSATVPAIMDRLAERYDCVIIDSSPLRAVADALPLANVADGVLVVARTKATRVRHVGEVIDQLDQVSAHLLAVVVSQVRSKNGQYSSYYGYSAAAASSAPSTNGRAGTGTATGTGDGRRILVPGEQSRQQRQETGAEEH